MIDFARWEDPALAAAYRSARPFGHVILDQVVEAAALAGLCQAISEEPHWPNRGEIYDFMGSATEVQHPRLKEFRDLLASPRALAAVRAMTGQPVGRVDLRSYVYLPGSYLLPHSDCQTRLGRLVAFAFYAWTSGCAGGELELFEVTMEGGHPKETRPALTIEPRENRLVLFEVAPATLHQVREVLAGARLSLSGWFLA